MKIKLKDNSIMRPTKSHATDAGYDIYSPIDLVIEGHDFSHRIDLGVGFQIPEGHVGIIAERSSQGKVGITTAGNVIDHGYTGNAHVTLINHQDTPVQISKGDRICQLLVIKIAMEEIEVVDSFDETERGDNAHGSTGR